MSAILLFDLDGTLIDSAPAIHTVSNHVLEARGFPALTEAQVRSFVGQGAPHLVRCLLQSAGQDPDGPLFSELYQDLVTRYETEVEGNRLYPHVLETLDGLRAQGHRLGLTTNKPYRPALAALRHVGLDGVFAVILGGDSLPTRKPEPAMLHEARAQLGGGPALYIGDSEIDAASAVNAALPFALYTEGYRKTPVHDLPHHVAFNDFRMLPGIVEAMTWA